MCSCKTHLFILFSDYTVKVQTSDDLGAGTDSDVFIRIIGERGTTKAFDLDNLWGHNDFEQNK